MKYKIYKVEFTMVHMLPIFNGSKLGGTYFGKEVIKSNTASMVCSHLTDCHKSFSDKKYDECRLGNTNKI